MGFVGGRDNIAIVTALPLLIFVMIVFKYLIFYACLVLRFLDVEINHGACRIHCSNVWGLSNNLSYLTVVSSQYDLLLCFDILVSNRRHISELLVNGFGRPVLLCLGPVEWVQMCEMDMGHFANQNLSVVVARCWY